MAFRRTFPAAGKPESQAARPPGFLVRGLAVPPPLAGYCLVGVGLTTTVLGRYKRHSPDLSVI